MPQQRTRKPAPKPENTAAFVREYRKLINERDRLADIAQKMRDQWKQCNGDDELHELAFGEPVED